MKRDVSPSGDHMLHSGTPGIAPRSRLPHGERDMESNEHVDQGQSELEVKAKEEADKLESKDKAQKGTSFMVFLNCYFIVIATVLGTGILGLPVKLAKSGFTPFIATYALGFVFQVFILYYMVELLQRAQVAEVSVMRRPAGTEDGDVSLDVIDGKKNAKKKLLGFIPFSDRNAYQKMDDDEVANSSAMGADGLDAASALDAGEGVGRGLAREDGAQDSGSDSDQSVGVEHPDEVLAADEDVGSNGEGALALGVGVRAIPVPSDVAVAAASRVSQRGPDLHGMSEFFLSPKLRIVFNIAVMLHFVSILISYGLAGSEAYGQLMNVEYQYLILPFVAVFACLVVFGSQRVAPFISTLTFAKGSLLVGMVAITGYVASRVSVRVVDDWTYVGQPFLIGTVALGGAANILPVAYARVKPTEQNIKRFRLSAVLALFTVWLLNVGWCYYLLKIVPHTVQDELLPNLSLESAAKLGEISTVPLIRVIEEQHPDMLWVAILVDCFIMLSITVSFVTMGTGMKHVLDGYVRSWWTAKRKRLDIDARIVKQEEEGEDERSTPTRAADALETMTGDAESLTQGQDGPHASVVQRARDFFANSATSQRFGLYAMCYILVTVTCVTNPEGFLIVMEYLTSLALNLEAGLFLVLMINKTREKRYQAVRIPVPLPDGVFKARYLVGLYFLFAVGYDMVVGMMGLIRGSPV